MRQMIRASRLINVTGLPGAVSRLFLVLSMAFAGVAAATAGESVLSPDKRFEAYVTSNTSDGLGAKLFLRAAGSVEPGVLLCRNDRWIAAQWSPDSLYLAVTDHSDGHVADVSIYRIAPAEAAPGFACEVRYKSPDPFTYDTKWEVIDWSTASATATLLRSTLQDKQRFTGPLDGGGDAR